MPTCTFQDQYGALSVPGCLLNHQRFGCSDASARGQLHNSITQNMFLILLEELICRKQKNPLEIFKAPQHWDAPLEGRGR